MNQKNIFPFTIEEKNVPEIGDKIFSFLDRKSLLVAREVCKEWNSYMNGQTGLWKNISSAHYQVLVQTLFIDFILVIEIFYFLRDF